MDLGLTGKSALITGGSKGIGYAAAWSLAREGCDGHLAARTESVLEQAKTAIGARFNVAVTIHVADLSKGDTARELIADCADIDILVNNAGAIPGGNLQAIGEDRWREAWDLKVFGYTNTCRAALENMKRRGSGVIINIIGSAGERPTPDYIVGAGGNAALMAMTRALGSTSGRDGIRVVGISPGSIQTERLITLARATAADKLGDAERWREVLDADFPPGRPEHIGDMVAFLASDLSANTTGTVITIDGGSSYRE